jgi:hypothetical protein
MPITQVWLSRWSIPAAACPPIWRPSRVLSPSGLAKRATERPGRTTPRRPLRTLRVHRAHPVRLSRSNSCSRRRSCHSFLAGVAATRRLGDPPSPPSLTGRLPWLLTAVYNAVQSSTPWLRGRSRSWPAVIRRAAGPPPGVHSHYPVGGIRGTPPGPLEYQISRPAGRPAGDSSTAATCQACRRRGTGRWPGPAKASWWMRAMPWWARRRGTARAARPS